MERKNKSPVWRVFVKDAARKRTLCTQCGKEFKYRYTTTNLRDHLKRYHPEWLPECADSSTNSTANNIQAVPFSSDNKSVSTEVANSPSVVLFHNPDESESGRKNKSAVWQVFVKDAENKNVTCTICQKEFKFWNNTTNLRAHLKRSHPNWFPDHRMGFVEEIELDGEQGDAGSRRSSTSSASSCNMDATNSDSLPNSDSPVWRVFVKDDSNKGVFCTLCQKHFGSLNNEQSMSEHLRRLHPDWEPSCEQISKVIHVYEENETDGKELVHSKSVFLVNSDRKNRSPVWDVFIKDTAKKRSMCMLCKKIFKCYSNTANLLDHLRRIHPDWKPGTSNVDIKTESPGSKRPLIARIRNSSESNDNNKSFFNHDQSSIASSTSPPDIKFKKVDKLIGEMICVDFQNLSIVEDSGFKKLIKELVPNYEPPTRKVIVKQTLPELYVTVSKQLRQTLEKCKYVAISVELWTNQNMEGFMTLTVHYFAHEKYTSSVLHTERINTEHSSGDLASVMHTILNEYWQIFEKVTAIVTDDDAALKAACDMLNITHIPCVAQLINNIITEELTQNDDAQQLLQRCLNLVAHFKLNPSATDVLLSIQSQQGLPVLHLKQVAPTRWNSALHMAQRLIELKEPLIEALNTLSEELEPLTTADWMHLTDFIGVLKPFELMTSELSADSYCNISKVVPLIRGVQSSLQNVNCVSDLGGAMKKSLLEKLELRFSTYEKYVIPSVATLLDPRFKAAGLGVEGVIESTRLFVIDQLSSMKNSSEEEIQGKNDEKSATSNSDIWNFLEKKVKETQKTPVTTAESIIRQYLELPYLKRHECPFRFWIGQSNLEPELADIAMKFMCIPATSFPAERLYSKNGITITERRNRMTTKHFDTIIFLNKNL